MADVRNGTIGWQIAFNFKTVCEAASLALTSMALSA